MDHTRNNPKTSWKLAELSRGIGNQPATGLGDRLKQGNVDKPSVPVKSYRGWGLRDFAVQGN